jgi:hypothetical protein
MSLRRSTHTLWARCSKNGRGNVTRLVKSKLKIQEGAAGGVRGKCRGVAAGGVRGRCRGVAWIMDSSWNPVIQFHSY